jgi:iron complex transport system substrate-binding protein
LQKPKCFVVIWGKPLWTASGKSYWGDLIRLAGGSNVAENELLPYPQYSEEMLVADQPDVILQSVATPGKQPSVDAIAHLNLPAFKHHRLYGIYQNWIDRPGPRLALGLRALAQDLHPGSVK